MLVRQLMNTPVACCTPWDTARKAARLMAEHNIGAVVVVAAISDPLLEGIVTDRDVCCRALATPKRINDLIIGDVMTPIPVTCGPDDTLDDCLELMDENHVRRIPVVNESCRCVGIVTLTDIAWHASPQQLTKTLKALAKPIRTATSKFDNKRYLYCGQTHEMDQILLLNRRRELRPEVEVLT